MNIEFERKVATIGDIQINYIAAGSGPPLLFLHGFPDYALGWRYQIEAFAKDYRVLAPDLRGVGLSSAPKGQQHYTLDHLVADTLAVLAAEGLSEASVIGHDWGATIAWWLAIRLPQAVRHLVALSTPHPRHFLQALFNPANTEILQYVQSLRAPGAAARLDIEDLSSWVPDAEDRQSLMKMLIDADLECMLDYYRANLPVTNNVDLSSLPHVRAPTLVLYGKRDHLVPIDAFQFCHHEIDGVSSTVAIPNAGHFIHQECPQFVTSQIRDWVSRPVSFYKTVK